MHACKCVNVKKIYADGTYAYSIMYSIKYNNMVSY